jgi:hypothetical protein
VLHPSVESAADTGHWSSRCESHETKLACKGPYRRVRLNAWLGGPLNAVEEVDSSGLERVLRADNQESTFLDQLLEDV